MKNPLFQGKPTSYRMLRGGSWSYNAQNLRVSDRLSYAQDLRVSTRLYYAPTFANYYLGFRIVRTKVES